MVTLIGRLSAPVTTGTTVVDNGYRGHVGNELCTIVSKAHPKRVEVRNSICGSPRYFARIAAFEAL